MKDAKINKKRLSKKGAVALSVVIAVLLVLALYFSITLTKQATAAPSSPYFIVRQGSTNNVAVIGSNGDMEVDAGVCELYGTIDPLLDITPDGDDFVIRNSGGNEIAMIDSEGYVYLVGYLRENRGSITEGTENFLVKNSGGSVIAKFESNSGDLFITGSLTSTTSIPNDGCCAVGENWVSDEGSCGDECHYTCVHQCGETGGGCKASGCAPSQYQLGFVGDFGCELPNGYCCCDGTGGCM